MQKFLNYFKRISALFLVCITISFSAFSSYASVPVQASGVLEVSIISSLIEALMASMGLSFSSTADLNNVVTGLDSMMTSTPDFTYKGVKVFEKIQEVLYSAKLGATVALPAACIEWFCNWLYGTSSDVLSDASDVIYQNPSVSVPSAQVIYGDFSKEFFESYNLFYGFNKIYDYYSDSEGSCPTTIGDDEPYLTSKLVVTIFNPKNNTFSLNYTNNTGIIYPSTLSIPAVMGSLDEVSVSSVFELFNNTGDAGTFYSCFFNCNYPSLGEPYLQVGEKYRAYSSKLWRLRYRSPQYSTSSDFNFYEATNYLPASSTNAVVRIFVNKTARFYDSVDQYLMEKVGSAYAPSSTIYGSSSASKELEKEEASGTVYLQLTQAQLTEKIEKAVADALAANPSITEEEINEMVAAQVGALSGVQDSIEEGTTVLSGIMQKVLSVLEGLADNILTGLVSLVVPSEGFIETQINNIMNRLNGMGIAPFDMSEIFTDDDESPFKDITIEVYGQEVVIVSFAHLDIFLDKFRPAIRGLIALFLIFYSIDQFLSLFSLGSMSQGGHVTSLANSLSSIVMPQGDSGRLGQKGELTKR